MVLLPLKVKEPWDHGSFHPDPDGWIRNCEGKVWGTVESWESSRSQDHETSAKKSSLRESPWGLWQLKPQGLGCHVFQNAQHTTAWLDGGQRAAGFKVSPVGVWSCFGPSMLPLGIQMFVLCHCMLEIDNYPFFLCCLKSRHSYLTW